MRRMASSARASNWALDAATWVASAGVSGAGTLDVEAATFAEEEDDTEELSGATDDAAGLATTAFAAGIALAPPALTNDGTGLAVDGATAVAAVEPGADVGTPVARAPVPAAGKGL